ncbi:phospholipase D-like domain-containing protein [Klebsiella aerogenes]|uniref:phospholipase D-like domain-containing protein n=1 Tax=Dryocola boscaweniae TaxID=2925397 RepID=UPI0022F04D83|nr:phospholipase D-like domain-containing protein [Dryocola boscaweniae]MCT4714499.1 phospholipase D-like domain-containing protein [Dryocola boscaweniae]
MKPSSHVILLPLYRGVAHLRIEKGEQWSDIEHMVLFSVFRERSTLQRLKEETRLSQSMLIEILIRLMRAGWIELLEEKPVILFCITDYGLSVVVKDKLPAITKEIKKSVHFAIDMLSGGVHLANTFPHLLSPNKAHRFLNPHAGDDDLTILNSIINSEHLHCDLEVLSKLSMRPDESIIGFNAEKSWVGKGWYAKLVVTEDEIEGLPAKGVDNLTDIIREQCIENLSGKNNLYSPGPHIRKERKAAFETHFVKEDNVELIVGGKNHEDFFHKVLNDAERWVIIHSTFINPERLATQLPFLAEASKRGVQIDILWDKDEDDNNSTDKLAECRKLLKENQDCRRVTIHDFTTNSHAKMIIADNGSDEYFSAIGSCNWLLTGFKSTEITSCIHDHGFVFDCLTVIGKLIHTPGKIQSKFYTDVINLGLNINPIHKKADGDIKVRLLSSACHEEMIHTARDTAKSEIFIASNKLGGAIENQVLIPADGASRRNAIEVNIYYERLSGPAYKTDIINEIKEKYGSTTNITQKRNAHAKFLVWDNDNAVVTSLNWLSKDADDGNPYSEIGVSITGTAKAGLLKNEYLMHKR